VSYFQNTVGCNPVITILFIFRLVTLEEEPSEEEREETSLQNLMAETHAMNQAGRGCHVTSFTMYCSVKFYEIGW